jgi:integrase
MRSPSFDRFCAEILSLNEPPQRAKATHRQLAQVLREFAEVPGLKTAAGLRPTAIAAWIKMHPDRTPVRTASLLRTLSPACVYAVSEGYLRQSPFDFRKVKDWVRVQRLEPEQPRPQLHRSEDAIASLLEYLDAEAALGGWKPARLQALVYLLAYTGLRKKEALHLKRWDVDLDRRVVRIAPRASNVLKTAGSAAEIPLADPLVEVLDRWLCRCGCDWVFPGVRLVGPWTGGPPGQKAIDRIRKAGEAVGIEGLTILGFRKTFGTLAKTWGLGQLEVKAVLRHSNVETQRWYDEEAIESLRPAVRKIQFRSAVSGAQA